MRALLGALVVLVGCSEATTAAPGSEPCPVAEASDAGDAGGGPDTSEDTYVRGGSVSVTGSSGGFTVACDDGDVLLSGECYARGGTVTESAPDGPASWRCVAKPDVEAKGALIVGWLHCAHR